MSIICDVLTCVVLGAIVVAAILMVLASIVSFTFLYFVIEPIIKLAECDDDEETESEHEADK